MTLTGEETRPFVRRLAEDLGKTDSARIRQIADLLDPATQTVPVGDVLASLFPNSASRDSQNKSFLQLRERFNEHATTAQLRIQLLQVRHQAVELARQIDRGKCLPGPAALLVVEEQRV